ncbi:MAG: signal peptidase I [Clostridia bacterium]|nr:signal peptidase I [Clostridia bacterium]
MIDKRKLHISSVAIFAVLLLALVLPLGTSGRILAAVLLAPMAVFVYFFIKKRSILSLNASQVLLLMTAIALAYLMLYYLSGFYFGFYKNIYKLNVSNILRFSVPIAVIIVSTEVIRYVMVAQEDKIADVLCYLSCVIAEMLVCSTIPNISSFARFMDLVAMTLFPAIVSNFLYHYLSKRYGMLPNIVFRLLTTLYVYLIPISIGISDSLVSFIKVLLPIAIFLFIDMLYEKKKRYALAKKNRLGVPITVLAAAILISVAMLVSNQFYYGALVIATESMTGEIDKGDVIIFESYEEQIIIEGQVIVFEKNGSMIVHRVADIQIINGNTRYYTKGDANDALDAGYITDAEIVGLVNYKIPYIGFPTLWLRSLFKR